MLRRIFTAALIAGATLAWASAEQEAPENPAATESSRAAAEETTTGAEVCAGHCALLTIRRIHVERLSGGDTADQIRDMIIAGFQKTGLFLLTEDPDRADAFLRGSAEDLIFNETHESRDGIDARGSVSLGSSTRSVGGRSQRNGGVSVNSSVGEDQSLRSVERRHEATAAVRLVDREGDVIWSTVQESRGAKFLGASADVADKVTRQLVLDHRQTKRRAGTAASGSEEPAKP